MDLSQPMELAMFMENFPRCKELVIPPGTVDYKVKLKLYDTQDRLLELFVWIKAETGGSLKVRVHVGLKHKFLFNKCPSGLKVENYSTLWNFTYYF